MKAQSILSSAVDAKIDIIYAASFLHLFTWAEQLTAAKRMVRMLKPKPGVLLLGRQVGTLKPGESEGVGGRKMYRHDGGSFKKLWAEVGRATGTEWRVWRR